MRGFAILFAILGFCSQYVNAVVVRGLSPVPKVEASADSSRVERAETLIFNKNNDAHATQTEVETGLSIDTGLILRQPPPPPPPNTPNQEHFPWDGNMLYYVQCIYDEQPLPRGRPRSPINVMRALVRRAFQRCARTYILTQLAMFQEAYIRHYGDDRFPDDPRP